MTDNETLLGYTAPALSDRIEDVAVEALGYILRKYAAARTALDSVVRSGVGSLEPVCEVRTQEIFDDWSRVDLVGIAANGIRHVLIEAKFYAVLTRRQPNAYLELLPKDSPSVLMFIAPEGEIANLWPRLRSRVEAHGKLIPVDSETTCMRVDGTERRLMVVSWKRLLGAIALRATDTRDEDMAHDIQQLRGLAEYAAEPPDPVDALRRIIVGAIDSGHSAGWADKSGLAFGRRSTAYPCGRYFRFDGMSGANTEFWLGVHREEWDNTGTPLWLDFLKNHELFDKLSAELPEGSHAGLVPIRPKTGVEYDDVLDDVVSQLKAIGERIRKTIDTKG